MNMLDNDDFMVYKSSLVSEEKLNEQLRALHFNNYVF